MSDEQAGVLLIEQLREEQRREWLGGTPIPAEDLFTRHPRLREDPALAMELIYHEVVLRAGAGEDPQLSEYASRFPDLADRLGPLFEVHRALERSSLEVGLLPIPTTIANPDSSTPVAAIAAPPGYELHDPIGLGGMGAVYRARDTSLNRDVAVKFLRDRFAADGPAARRFQEEARITGQLQHPGIPPVHQVGHLPDGRPFLVMKLIRGRTLADLLRDPAVDRGALVAVFEQVCQAVGYAHAHKVIHRDLKPANVMVGAFGEVQVMDWGLAKILSGARDAPGHLGSDETQTEIRTQRTPDSATQAGDVLGTPAFMPPEQAGGELDKVDERSDVFGLGALLCMILTGNPPYVGTHPEAVKLMAIRGQLADAFALLDGCGAEPDLVALCKRCLSAEQDDRPRHAGEVAKAVAGLRAASDERARRAELDRVRAEADRRAAEQEAAGERKRRRAQLALVGSGLALVIAAGGVAWYFQAQRAEQQVLKQRAGDGVEAALLRLPELYQRGLWPQAEATLDQADTLLGPEGVPGLRERVESAKLNTAFIKRIDRIRLDKAMVVGGKLDHGAASKKYVDAFHDNGYDVRSTDPAELAAKLNASPVREYLLAALDDWALTGIKSPDRVRIFAITAAATGHQWRRKLPDAWDDAKQLAALYDAIPLEQRSPALIAQVGWRLNELGADGVRRLEDGLRQYPSDFWLHTWLGIMDANGRDEAQIGACRAALAIRPDTSVIYVNLATFLSAKGDNRGAATAAREAIRLDPLNATAHSNLGVALLHQDPDAAIAECKEAIRLDPEHAEAHNNLGTALTAKGDPDGALAALMKAARLNSEDARIQNNLGLAYMKKGNPAAAVIAFSEAIRLAPKNAVFHTHLGAARHGAADPKGAVDAYLEAIRLNDKYAMAHHNLGVVYRDRGDRDNAIATFRKAVDVDPKYVIAHLSLGNALMDKGDLKGAERVYRKLLNLDDAHANARNNLGLALQRQGDLEGALVSLQHALRMEPENKLFQTNLRQTERWRDMLLRLPDIAAGRAEPATSAESIEFAGLCTQPFQKRYVLAVRLYTRAFAADPKLAANLIAQHRYNAACAAALAAAGQDAEMTAFGVEEWGYLTDAVYRWLRADLVVWTALVKDPATWPVVRKTLIHWKQDSDLIAIRDPARLAAMPEPDRKRWGVLWADVDTLLAAMAPPAATPTRR